MILTPMTPESSIPAALLYNEALLRQMLRGAIIYTARREKDWYADYAQYEFQLAFQHQRNEIFTSRWTYFCEHYKWNEVTGPVIAALEALYTEYLETRNHDIHVRLERFGEWQNLMANICAQPVLAFAAHETHKYESGGLAAADVSPDLLCYPYEIAVEDYIDTYGLNDAHVHINACSYAESSWLYALMNPDAAYSFLVGRTHDSHAQLQQMLEVFDSDSVSLVRDHLRIARNLRAILRAHVCSPPRFDSGQYDGGALVFLSHCAPDAPLSSLAEFELPFDLDEGDWQQETPAQIIRKERLWMASLIRGLLRHRDSEKLYWLHPLFHTYLLLMNEYMNLFTQREQQKGFDKFNKTQSLSNSLAWNSRYYYECFRHFHGNQKKSIVHHVDARIVPKATVEGNIEQIRLIVKDYFEYLREIWLDTRKPSERLPELDRGRNSIPDYLRDIDLLRRSMGERHVLLNLTAHFIKKPWKWKDEESYRHHGYRDDLARSCRMLKETFARCEGVKQLLTAVDAANDEQHMPPSVFAPAFRYCRRILSMDNITFHCGEDFPHLLSGLRVLDDVINTLDLDSGDRIGHATALGIDPKLWRHNVPKYLYVKRESRMLDLLFALRELRKTPTAAPEVQEAACRELLEQAHQLFDVCQHLKIDYAVLQEAMSLRGLSPKFLYLLFGCEEERIPESIREFKQDPEAFIRKPIYEPDSPFVLMELELIKDRLSEASSQAILLLMMWFTRKDIWEKGQKMVEVKVEKAHDPLYFTLQRHLMQRLHDKRVVVETLPTSNLRISYYRNAWEHHAMRWLCKRPEIFKDDPKIFLTFGSDDPGVFTCDTKSEFYLLYSSLRRHGITEQEAIALLHEVNNRGRVYSFSNTNIRDNEWLRRR